ncbi:MAG: DUF1571 domain-containing protein [Aquabacterium sp.]|uniref:DUF1571 domain-containing protein n=1 Tax=Aquabacterium sp. TaxID=1872578 RepID=UPI0025BB33AD|nr:DUF1571 domain-containing protein [Aquabacterium sp.]MBI5926054.1 DUF1571 domain-containing protein [Aquabacterium sp.]
MKSVSIKLVLVSLLVALAGLPSVHAASNPVEPGALAAQSQAARAFAHRLKAGEIAAMSDEDVVKVFRQLHPDIISAYLEVGAQPYSEYELWMHREERIGGVWPDKPFVNYIKYRQKPRQVYVKWLEGGAKAGQEMIFDESKRKDEMYGHIGGLFNVMSIWTSIHGVFARNNSNHTVADLGIQAIFDIVNGERALYLAEGQPSQPQQIEVMQVNGTRVVALTWIAPSRKHYAHKTRVFLELHQPMVRGIEAWNEAGAQIERIIIDKIVPARFQDADFDPANKAYAF